MWGTDLYAVAANDDLIGVDLLGTATNHVGTGFGNISDLQFGPNSELYASEFSSDRVYRFARPEVPGARTTIYARVTDPVRLSFAPDGTLFAGRDNSGSGGDFDDAVKIHRIGPGGTLVEEYGNSPITDPDAVFYDTMGQFSGTPGAVIVAGQQLNSTVGKIVKILPDGTIVTIYGPTAFGFNPNLFVLDVAGGRLLFSDDVGGKVWAMTNSTPTVLVTLAGALHFTTDVLHRLVVGASDSPTLRLYSRPGRFLGHGRLLREHQRRPALLGQLRGGHPAGLRLRSTSGHGLRPGRRALCERIQQRPRLADRSGRAAVAYLVNRYEHGDCHVAVAGDRLVAARHHESCRRRQWVDGTPAALSNQRRVLPVHRAVTRRHQVLSPAQTVIQTEVLNHSAFLHSEQGQSMSMFRPSPRGWGARCALARIRPSREARRRTSGGATTVSAGHRVDAAAPMTPKTGENCWIGKGSVLFILRGAP
ncbi:MAG: hypothetical protein NT154_20950 [Verrucomicrobia bacterium]|nr:hypothetical protein [Verrucomicrobiota bacterium]